MQDSIEKPSTHSKFSVKARLKSFYYAGKGLRNLVQDEHNSWIHLAASITVVATGLVLQIPMRDWRWIVAAIATVWVAEAFNTAIEELCDRITPQFDEVIGRVKDLAAGGVLIASVAAAIIGLLTFMPYLREAF